MDDHSSKRFPPNPQRRIASGRLLDWPAGVLHQLNPHGCTYLPKLLNSNRVLLKGPHDWDPEKGTASSCHVFKPIYVWCTQRSSQGEESRRNSEGVTFEVNRNGKHHPTHTTDNTKQSHGKNTERGIAGRSMRHDTAEGGFLLEQGHGVAYVPEAENTYASPPLKPYATLAVYREKKEKGEAMLGLHQR